MSAEFINEIIKNSDPFIRKYGGKEGYRKFREEEYKKLTPDGMAKEFIESISAGEAESPFYARTLLSLYVEGEKRGKTPQSLKDWVLDSLSKIGDGESADSAFSLKARKGVKRTKPMHNQLRYVCFVTLKMREGMSKPEAIKVCVHELKADDRHVYRLMKEINVSNEISDKTLIFFRDNDVSDDYSPF